MTFRWPVPINLRQPGALAGRLQNSAVVWSWIFNFFRLASGLILLPLVLNKLPTAELGMYYVFLSLSALVPLVDFGFGPTIGRFVSYAMGGAASIQVQGVAEPSSSTTPNYDLLWQLFFTARTLYRFLILVLLVILGTWGTFLVEMRINETASVLFTRLAWVATLMSALFDIYSGWWVIYLRSMNEVLAAARIGILALAVRLILSSALLLGGAGLLSVPVGSFFGSLLQRYLARQRCQQLLAGHSPPGKANVKENLQILWPNTWRTGVFFISGYLTVNANTAICLNALGLAANARYGLSAQLLSVITGMAAVWIGVKWPIIGQYYARHEHTMVQRILRPRIWLQNLTFLVAAVALLLCGPFLLTHFGGGKQLLPLDWFAVMTLGSFLEMQFNLWTTLMFTGNRLPFLWPAVASNVLSLALSLSLIQFTPVGLGALVLGPLIAGSLFNYWYWPLFAPRDLGTSLMRLMFLGPPHHEKKETLPTG